MKNKNILIGITGSIAAYKICELISFLKKDDANIKVIMTKAACEFVTPLTFETLTGNQVYTQMFSKDNFSTEHISLSKWADLFVIAPATANIISKLEWGICDDLLTTEACAFTKKIMVAPAMNVNMYNNPVICENVKKLAKKNIEIIEPAEGVLACGDYGKGKLADVDTIYKRIKEHFAEGSLLAGKKILITGGATKEFIDDVRYITNKSTGKMGLALATCAKNMGADAFYITGSNNTFGLTQNEYKIVGTASDMYNEVKKRTREYDCFIGAAAVGDYTPAQKIEGKLKKSKQDLNLKLVSTKDIISDIASDKKEGQIICGFAAETSDHFKNAENKLKNKNLDFIVVNDVSESEIGFGSEDNEVTIINKKGAQIKLSKDTKYKIAKDILKYIFR